MSKKTRSDYWQLYKKLEKTIGEIQETKDTLRALTVFLDSLVQQYSDSLGIEGGRLYKREDASYELVHAVDLESDEAHPPAPSGYRIPNSYPIIRELRERGLLITDRSNPSFDPAIEGPLAVDTFAAITVGAHDGWIISFTLSENAHREHVLYTLSIVRQVFIGKLRQLDVEGELLRVREIQSSLFPRSMPRFDSYDIFGHSRPSEEIGGDVYSFISLSPHMLGILVADSSGHGLPAALQARDVVTGMRMGLEEDLKIVSVVEKLNRVIHETSMSSKFVSLFYGELERNGNFIYCNAGHVPTLCFQNDQFTPLTRGGPVLGPSPLVRYHRGYVTLSRGDILVLYSDGITEAHNDRDEEFGLDRLQNVIREYASRNAEEITNAIFAAVNQFAPDDPLRDDQTVVVVVRTGDIT